MGKKENGIVAWQHEYVAVRPTGYKKVKIRLKKSGSKAAHGMKLSYKFNANNPHFQRVKNLSRRSGIKKTVFYFFPLYCFALELSETIDQNEAFHC
ncbi:hypothetical protein ACFQUX_23770 [Pantoea stewartii]